MSARILLSHEAREHITILGVLDQLSRCEIGDRTALHIMWRPLESFAPRCNCGRVLSFGPWREGRRLVACRCGVTYSECGLWHGVPKVEWSP